MFTPKWKKEAKLLLKGAKKFLHYKRDLLKTDRIDEIESRRADLQAAIQANDESKAAEASKQLRATCESALPRFPQQSWWEENVEVIWVALVVALGLRAYVIQPFRIPTGSMQPTLNGITIEQEPNFKEPWLGKQAIDFLLRGRIYRDIVAENDCTVTGTRDVSWFLFTGTEVSFDNGPTVRIPTATGVANELLGLRLVLDPVTQRNILRGNHYSKGQPILRGAVDSGDLVLVDKISYHFRRPKRGEVFVFDTRGLPTNPSDPNKAKMAGQEGGTHFIKRLGGVPGDTLEIRSPDVIVNGKVAQEFGMRRVAEAKGIYGEHNPRGYIPAISDPRYLCPLDREGRPFFLKDKTPPGMREYAALGDNQSNSLDSRYWGSVKEFNLAGPALFSLWPITTDHWGFIR